MISRALKHWACAAVLALSAAALSIAPSAVLAAALGEPSAPAPSAAPYRLGAGDKLRIATFGEATLSGQFEVSGAGVIDLPLIGEVTALGLTTSELQSAIVAALRDGYLKDPKVAVEVLSYRPYYILGEVQRPGEYPYSSGLTVMNAVATANGFTYRANTRKVAIRRAGEAQEHEHDLTLATPVAPGDTLRIRERRF